jgi:type I restriction enzyme S subunit
MSEWKQVIFEDTFEIPLRNGLTKPSIIRGDGIRMVNMKEIFGYDVITDKTPMELVPIREQERSSLLKFNDLLFARQSLVESGAGKISIFKGKNEAVFESHLIRCRINNSTFNPDFIYYLFKSPVGRNTVSTIVQQTAAAGIRGSDLKNLKFTFPPFPEQRAIASVLSSLDDKIDLLHRQNATIEKMAETLFRQWFVEEANEDWETNTISYFADFFNGKSRPNEVGHIPIYGGNGIFGYTSKSNYSGKSIIIGRVGAYCGSLYYENNDIWISDNALLVKAKNEYITHFLFYLLKTLDLNSMAEGSSHPLLTQTLLKSIEIHIPPIEKIKEFDSQLEAIQNKIESNQTQIRTLTALRDTLLPKLMSGEVRVEI